MRQPRTLSRAPPWAAGKTSVDNLGGSHGSDPAGEAASIGTNDFDDQRAVGIVGGDGDIGGRCGSNVGRVAAKAGGNNRRIEIGADLVDETLEVVSDVVAGGGAGDDEDVYRPISVR